MPNFMQKVQDIFEDFAFKLQNKELKNIINLHVPISTHVLI